MKKVNINTQKLYSTKEVSNILGISHVAVYKKIVNNHIPAHKVGRNYVIKGDDLYDYLHPAELTDNKKKLIEGIVSKVIVEYGEALKKLGKE